MFYHNVFFFPFCGLCGREDMDGVGEKGGVTCL